MKHIVLLALLSIPAISRPVLAAGDDDLLPGDTAGTAHPWSSLEIQDQEPDFRFAIVGDRTGGHRPGVFEDAVRKLNLLRPEFVLSTGDLIEGYTADRETINREWDEFEDLINPLKMPFFYLSGNHDYTNQVMAEVWRERFGPSFYHFLYRNVLFLCLNTQEAAGGPGGASILEDQYRFVKNQLEAHRDARWTFVIMHRPLWLEDSTGYWKDIEALLDGRNYTVFAGDNHNYVKYERHGRTYITLATTGGLSKLRGPNYGEFDGLVWVSMTAGGPVISNLLLSGIWDENIVTEEMSGMLASERIQIDPLFVENGSREGELSVRLENGSAYPMWTVLRFGESTYLRPEILEYQKTVAPNSRETVNIEVNLRPLSGAGRPEPVPLYAWFVYRYRDGRDIKLDQQFNIAPVGKEYIKKSSVPVVVDGDPGEWNGLPFRGGLESYITDGKKNYHGDYDAQYDFNLSYDEQYLYLALSVWDDELVLVPGKSVWVQDAVLICLDPRPLSISANDHSGNLPQHANFRLLCAPSLARNRKPLIEQGDLLPEGTKLATRKSVEGFTLELAIPMTYINRLAGGEWKTVRFNLAYFDKDEEDGRTAIWWKPDWSTPENYIGSGMFFRSGDR